MADKKAPTWVWRAALGGLALITLVGMARLDVRTKSHKELLDERYKTQEHNVEVALKTLTEKTAQHNEVLAAWREDRANSPSRTELIGIVTIIATIITVVISIVTK